MQESRQAAIDVDDIRSKALHEISAADFLTCLERDNLSIKSLVGLPEKKKYELWVGPEEDPPVNVGDLCDWIRIEKKKIELEVPPDFNWQEIHEARYNDLVARVAQDVEARLRQQS